MAEGGSITVDTRCIYSGIFPFSWIRVLYEDGKGDDCSDKRANRSVHGLCTYLLVSSVLEDHNEDESSYGSDGPQRIGTAFFDVTLRLVYLPFFSGCYYCACRASLEIASAYKAFRVISDGHFSCSGYTEPR